MAKKVIANKQSPKRISTRIPKKKQPHPNQLCIYQPELEDDSLHDDGSDSGDSNEEDSSSQEESSQIPAEPAIKNMQFRQRRGTKMNALISRKKQQQQDSFWAQYGQQYFGDLEDGDNDEEDYVQSSSGQDEFDSDFDKTESNHEEQEGKQGSEREQLDENQEKQKRRRQDLMRKIHAPVQKKVLKTAATGSAVKKQTEEKNEIATKYIHQAFNQEELLGEAATTEYFNWISLKKLISIESEKKDFTIRSHHIEGPKVIYRDKINSEGKRETSYELSETAIKDISQLSQVLNKN